MKGMDPNALLAQARKLKDDLARVERDLAQRIVEGKAAGDAVRVVLNANSEVQAVSISPSAVDPDDLSLLEDLVLVAMKDALTKAKKIHEEAMQKATGGMGGIPGLF